MTLLKKMADLIAVGEARRRAVISGSYEAIFFNENGSGVEAVAGSSHRNGFDDGHKIVVPFRSVVFSLVIHSCILIISFKKTAG